MWKVLAESVAGTSHTSRDSPCQDACGAALVERGGGTVLVLAAADGAGSAAHAEVGARVACDELLRRVEADVRDGLDLGTADRDQLVYWLTATRNAVLAESSRRECRPRDLASTVLLAAVGDTAAAFAQIGDGAIVLHQDETLSPVFWPPTGEYANTTYFLTDEDFAENACYEVRCGALDEVAVLTDGLQRLALDYTTRHGHPGFFLPMFSRLRDAPDPAALREPLRLLLDSPRVNDRTDDDKTLILASRVPPRAPAHNQPG